MDKKKLAKEMMLKKLSKLMSDDMYGDLGEGLKSKKLSKVTVVSDSPEGLKKGLSKAEQIMRAKLNKGEVKDEYDMEDEFPMSEESCPVCKGKGCKACEESEEEEESEEDME